MRCHPGYLGLDGVQLASAKSPLDESGSALYFYAKADPSSAELVIKVAVSIPVLDREKAALDAEAGVKE